MKSIEIKKENIIAIVDYRTELLGILMWISGYHNLLPECFSIYENKFYVENILNNFLKYKDEEVVKEFMKLVEKHQFVYDAPYALFLQLNEHLKCDKLDNYVFKERLEEDEAVYKFIDKLEDFAKKINFENYYNSNIELYQKWTKYVLECFEKGNILNFYNSYFGKTDKEFYLNLIPFASDGSSSASIGNKIYDMNPVTKDMKEETLFEREDYKMVIGAPIHEFLHGYINPITEKINILNSKTNMFDDIREEMAKQAYPTDVEIINEHLVRALQIRYIINEFKDEQWAEWLTNKEEKLGFIYIRPILKKLEEFENNRDKYKSFEDIYPEIVESLKTKNIPKQK